MKTGTPSYVATIAEAYQRTPASRPRFHAGASVEELAGLRSDLDPPASLCELLSQTDGVMSEVQVGDAGEWIDDIWLILPTAEIRARNGAKSLRLVFADAGVDGITFGFERDAIGVFAWGPFDDSSRLVAHSLEDFLSSWICGELGV
jgi:hypothetical protein